MKSLKPLSLLLALALALSLISCTAFATGSETEIVLSDSGVTVDGAAASTSSSAAVYVGADIVYYEEGKDSSYGAGSDSDAHSAEEAAAHTVVTITKPGTYRISGTLSAGQIAVDLGDGSKNDPEAVATLILDGVDITCTVAPAVIFYRTYECGDTDRSTATSSVDTSEAGANVLLADGSTNYVSGSYVSKIYEEGTTNKLHKYDCAFYSKRSMNISGEAFGTGKLYITAENEGLGSECHLTINGGSIYIESRDDGINTNEDYVSVTTVNGGYLHINAGLGSEGDGIDSNGWIVINGGEVVTMANPTSPDGGIDAYCKTIINGGTLIATGRSNDETDSVSAQPYMELQFSSQVAAGSVVEISDADGSTVFTYTAEKAFNSLTVSNSSFAEDTTYYVYVDGARQQYSGNGFGMMGGGWGEGMTRPEGMTPPEGMTRPEGSTPSDGINQAAGVEFVITESTHSFSGITAEGGAASSAPEAGEASDGLPFTDIAGNEYLDAIKFVYKNGLMNGISDTDFSPDTPVSRAMAITVLARLAKAEACETDDFTDVVSGSWYAPYVGWAVQSGVVSGYGNGKYGPDDSVSRQQICVIMNNYANSKSISLNAGELVFSDSSAIADWASEATAACKGAGLLDGIAKGSSFSGGSALTRAELADVLMRLAQII